jgi:hypothetical protein
VRPLFYILTNELIIVLIVISTYRYLTVGKNIIVILINWQRMKYSCFLQHIVFYSIFTSYKYLLQTLLGMRNLSQGSSQTGGLEYRFDRGALHQNYAQKNKLRVLELKGFGVEQPQYGLTLKHLNTATSKLNSLEEL